MQLVADANVLLSAVIGGPAMLVLQHPNVEAVYVERSRRSPRTPPNVVP